MYAQSKIDVVSKENKYGGLTMGEGGYNAVHYTLVVDSLVVEYQVKAKVNKLEAGLSHDLVLSDDKFRDRFNMDPLPAAQKDLIERVINISSQLSMREFSEIIEGLEVSGSQMDSTLYGEGGDKSEDEVSESLRGWKDPETGQNRLASILLQEGLFKESNHHG
jgi:hypothetical protein